MSVHVNRDITVSINLSKESAMGLAAILNKCDTSEHSELCELYDDLIDELDLDINDGGVIVMKEKMVRFISRNNKLTR